RGSSLSGVPREQVLAEMRGDAKAAQQQNPGSYLAGQIGGGLAQGVSGVGGRATKAAIKGGGTLGKIALGSTVDGIVGGGAYGAGSADEGNRVSGGAWGAGLGGLTGLAAPLAIA
ncbi:hypothetical protein CWB66_22160, partial [Pseudoalteromonas sp. S558]